jgi:hypothetical protein
MALLVYFGPAMLVSIPGLPQNQACEAVALSGNLTDPEVFVLMGCLHLGKSRSERVFAQRSLLQRPSVVLPLRNAGIDVSEVLDSLVSKGYINRAGFGRVQVSDRGKVIEHRFSILRDTLALRGMLPEIGTRLTSVPELRTRMKDLCETGGLLG